MNPGKIYLDNCVTSAMAPEALEAMLPYFSDSFWYPGSFVSTGESANEALASFQRSWRILCLLMQRKSTSLLVGLWPITLPSKVWLPR
ncbi:MAG: hypothetical protein LRZ88_10265 [Candidatus Cloacimonetes bacterium]|nr:hypothetical protein [Candidatus Cloacimonadota bacterium]